MLGRGAATSTRSSASTDGLQTAGMRPPVGSTASAATALQPGAGARTAKQIAKPPPPMPLMERRSEIPEGLRLALEALTESEKNWDRPPGLDPIYCVQVGGRMYHRNDIMRQAMALEQHPAAEVPRLQLRQGQVAVGRCLPHCLPPPPTGQRRTPRECKWMEAWELRRPIEATLDEAVVNNTRLRWRQPLHRRQACSVRQPMPVECRWKRTRPHQ